VALAAEASTYDVIIDTLPYVDSKKNTLFLNMLKPMGTLVILGLGEFGLASVGPLIGKQLSIVGSLVGSRQEMRDMLDFCSKNSIEPMSELYSFEEFPKAFDKMENGRPKFRCVVNCGEFAKKHNLSK